MVGPFLPRRDLLAAQSVLDDQDQQRQTAADDWLKSAWDKISNPFGQPAAPAPMPMAPAAGPMAVGMPQASMPAPQPAAQPSLERVADDWLKSAWEKVN